MDKFNLRTTIKNTSILSTLTTKTEDGKTRLSIRGLRWLSILSVHTLFFLSFSIDIQLLEGTLNGSRFLGFHLIDTFSTFEVFLATHHLSTNMIIGSLTVLTVYLLIGGRTYCSWICPYGLLSEIGEKIHNSLINKKIIKERAFNNKVRYFFWALFLLLSFGSGYLVFETINIVGILSRAITYGWSVALSWVIAVLLIEITYSRRAWCKYICPIGTTYSILGKVSATRIEWDDSCDHCMVCHDVCFEDQVLELTKVKYDKEREEKGITHQYITGGDCTLCGRCVDSCHQDSLNFNFRWKELV